MKVLSFLVISALVAALANANNKGLSCETCLRLADLLRIQLAKLEPEDTTEPTDVLVGEVQPRRRLIHPRSETQIFKTLDGLCDQASERLGEQLGDACKRVIPKHREELEERIYEDGFLHVRDLLCADLAHACTGHELFDSGEL
ncbi:hypothetical protein WJX81_006402 [Elliptochloris bilobata]|uniref:Saposin B-type domain-containing protein n=1 Tax=Elliptochloris bilobata TaxID=381761 RepID=A0AAW1SIE8_9CHLO